MRQGMRSRCIFTRRYRSPSSQKFLGEVEFRSRQASGWAKYFPAKDDGERFGFAALGGGEFDIGQTPGDIVPGEIKPDFTGD